MKSYIHIAAILHEIRFIMLHHILLNFCFNENNPDKRRACYGSLITQ